MLVLVDELMCCFVSRDGWKYDVYVNIMVSGWLKYYFYDFFLDKFIVFMFIWYYVVDLKIMLLLVVKWMLGIKKEVNFILW